jgi:hypothetical protein
MRRLLVNTYKGIYLRRYKHFSLLLYECLNALLLVNNKSKDVSFTPYPKIQHSFRKEAIIPDCHVREQSNRSNTPSALPLLGEVAMITRKYSLRGKAIHTSVEKDSI